MVQMSSEPTRVLIVDDSALVRQILEKILSSQPGIEVVGTASDGTKALAAVERLKPDVVTLDVEMPGLSGLEVLDRLRGRDVAVVVVASPRGSCDLTFEALERGAIDFCSKPTSISDGLDRIAAELVHKVQAARRSRERRAATRTNAQAARPAASPLAAPSATTKIAAKPGGRAFDRVIAIGASTGGPEAVAAVLSAMPANAPPIVVVQHMPEYFTAKFAQRLDGVLDVRVKEAEEGDVLRPGLVLLAPGTKHHMVIRREVAGLVVRLNTDAPIMHHRPSVDVMFRSCAEVLGRRAVAVLLTGMGSDGALGMLAMRQAGAVTIAQDEKTSLVYGMPMEAAALGAACHVLPLDEIGPAALRLAQGANRIAAA